METLFQIAEPDPRREHADTRLAGMAEAAKIGGVSRQAVTNMRSRDANFPAPLADLASGPVFREADLVRYFKQRGREVQPTAYGQVQRKRTTRFDPLDRVNLAQSVERALLEEPMNPLPPAAPFAGAGLYCIYYLGSYEPYAKIASSPKPVPLYVGRAIPKGARAGVGGVLSTIEEPVLFNRLREHSRSIEQVENHGVSVGQPELQSADFRCRFLVVEDIWVPLAEALLIGHFQPLWNQVLQGFGNHDPGGGRRRGARPDWDELHPGRSWAMKQAPARRDREESLERVRAHLNNLLEPDLGAVPNFSEEQLNLLGTDND
ncbi:Eco29kI family restriction endonuclease [Actinoplanes sp. NPDC089786]|uniref:Eco29kI family restriction endonuclease n=1 Tax=Actinoplanes sp. NPDC089786 TaxID=3155185 RepID=UPI00342D1CBD